MVYPVSLDANSLSVAGGINFREVGGQGDGITDDSEALINAIAAVKPGGIIYLPATGRNYIIKRQIPSTKGYALVGDGYGASIIEWQGAAQPDGVFRWYGTSGAPVSGQCYGIQIRNIGIRCLTEFQATTLIQMEDVSQFIIDNVQLAGPSFGANGNNGIGGIHIKNTVGPNQVPERGLGQISNLFFTSETGTKTRAGSFGLWLEGIAAQALTHIIFGGIINLEQCEYGLRMDYATACVAENCGWLLQGNANNFAAFNSSDSDLGRIICHSPKTTTGLPPTNDNQFFMDATCQNIGWKDPGFQNPNGFTNNSASCGVGLAYGSSAFTKLAAQGGVRPGQITNNTGGVVSNAVAAAPGVYAAGNFDNIHATILDRLNKIEAVLGPNALRLFT